MIGDSSRKLGVSKHSARQELKWNRFRSRCGVSPFDSTSTPTTIVSAPAKILNNSEANLRLEQFMYTTRPTTRTTRRTDASSPTPASGPLDSTHTSSMTPRTAATRAPHRVTVRKTAQQVNRLQELWQQTTTPTKEQREQIADEIGLDVRIVSTWFRDERSKLTRQRAEQQRAERNAAVASSTVSGPIRSARIATAATTATRRFQSDGPSELDEDDEHQQQHQQHQQQAPLPPLFDRHTHHHHQRASPVTATTPRLSFTKSPRFSPYPLSPARPGGAAATMAAASSSMRPAPQRQHQQHALDTLVRPSMPIDIHRPAHHRNQLSDSESTYGSPGFPRQSVPAPSVASSEDTSEDELDDEDEARSDLLGYRMMHDVRDYSPRTPSHMPSSLPSPRVMHAPSTSIPSGGLPPISTLGLGVHGSSFSPLPHTKTLPQLSPFRTPITLPTDSGKTFTIEPLPIITGPQPARDSSWRWNYYDKVSSMRQTLSGKLYAHDPVKSSSTVPSHMRRADDSDEEDELLSEEGPSPISSPLFRHTRLDSSSSTGGSMFDRLGGLFTGSGGTGKKQLFASSTANGDKTM